MIQIGEGLMTFNRNHTVVYVCLIGSMRPEDIVAISKTHHEHGVCKDMIIDCRRSSVAEIPLEEWREVAESMDKASVSRGSEAKTIFVVANEIEMGIYRLFNALLSAANNPVQRDVVESLEAAFTMVGGSADDFPDLSLG